MSRVRASSKKIYFCSPGFLPGSQQYDQTSETKVETIKIKNEKLSNIVNFVTFWKLVSWKLFHSCWSLSALKSIVTSFFSALFHFFRFVSSSSRRTKIFTENFSRSGFWIDWNSSSRKKNSSFVSTNFLSKSLARDTRKHTSTLTHAQAHPHELTHSSFTHTISFLSIG